MRPAGSSSHLDDTSVRPPAPRAPDLRTLAASLRSGALDLDEHLATVERRIARREPEIQALLPEPERFARLAGEAEALRRRDPQPASRGPLWGVLVAVKDVFHVDGFATGGGAHLPAGTFAGPEAAAVVRLRAAGALVLGKAVSTELAYFAPGPTRNPRAPAHTPGGSSSGSAAAVAAGYCALALGTQTIGSTVRPAAYCGVAGWKPSHGRIPRAGVLPLAPSFDDVGVFTPEVGDLAIVAPFLADGWREERRVATGVAGAALPRLAVPTGPYLERASDAARSHLAVARERLERAGYVVSDVAVLADFGEITARHARVVAAEAFRAHGALPPDAIGALDARTRELLERGAAVSDAELAGLRAECAGLAGEIARAMTADGVDLWLTPGAPGPAPAGLGATGDPVMSLPWSQAGLPAVAVPAGRSGAGLPLGIQLVAAAGDDERLLAWASAIAALVR